MDIEKCETFSKSQESTESLKDIFLVPAVWH